MRTWALNQVPSINRSALAAAPAFSSRADYWAGVNGTGGQHAGALTWSPVETEVPPGRAHAMHSHERGQPPPFYERIAATFFDFKNLCRNAANHL